MIKLSNLFGILPVLFIIVSCGGGGGGSAVVAPPALSLNLSASLSQVAVGTTVTLTWSTNDAACAPTASGSWSGTKSGSGTEVVTISSVGPSSFALTCGNLSSSASVTGYRTVTGTIVDGYLSDALVFVDTNSNFEVDGSEVSTTSDSNGAFAVKYDNGQFVSLGGTDVDTQTLLSNLVLAAPNAGYAETSFVITPVTTIATFMDSPDNIYAALGLDASIDIFTTDPVANKDTWGMYALLYEKGNQLTVLALTLSNVTNSLKSTSEDTSDYFEGIASELETAFAATSLKVDIESSAFIGQVIDGLIEAKSVTISDSSKTNLVAALSAIMPLIQVKGTNAATSSILNFSLKTLQTDILTIASGSASEDLLAKYGSGLSDYIASVEPISLGDLTPSILAFNDSVTTLEDTALTINVAANDDLVAGNEFTVSVSVAPAHGVATISGNNIQYTPTANYDGSDTLSYTITQNSATSTATVAIAISPVNDAPSIDGQLSLNLVSGGTTVTGVSVSDVDGDAVTLTVSGTDAASFEVVDGVLKLKSPADYFTKRSYEITLTASDGVLSTSKTITLTILRGQMDGFEVPLSVKVIETV